MTVKKTEQIERALEYVKKKGFSYRTAAKVVGLHPCTVERWAKRTGITSPHARKLLSKKVFGVQVKPEPSLWQKIKKLLRL